MASVPDDGPDGLLRQRLHDLADVIHYRTEGSEPVHGLHLLDGLRVKREERSLHCELPLDLPGRSARVRLIIELEHGAGSEG